MLRQARRLASTARAIGAGNWQQARKTNGPRAYDGLLRQRAAHGLAAREADDGELEAEGAAAAQAVPRAEAEPLLVWSTMGETQRKLYFEGEHTFPHDHSAVVPMVKRLLASGEFSLRKGSINACSMTSPSGSARAQRANSPVTPAQVTTQSA